MLSRKSFLPLLAMGLFAVSPLANASAVLIASGGLNSATDLSGLTYTLENGLPANILGGMGSGLAWAGGNTFIALPDRGPNATAYNSQVDDTVSYISRFNTVTMSLLANTSGSGLAYTLTPTLAATTLLSSATPLTYGTGAGLGNTIGGTPIGSGAPTLTTSSWLMNATARGWATTRQRW